ncbi:MAG: hypothetical protein WBD65_09480 [Methylocella sp.]
MIRAFLAFMLLVVSATLALALSPSQNMIVGLPHTICPYAGAGFADGCAGAQPGAPQNPTLLLQYGANRPPWNVAGVDYAVGAVGPFNDPSVSGNLPACASYSAGTQNTVTVNSAPCSLSNLDFSLHGGICLSFSSAITNNATVSITNNNFSAGPNCQPLGGGILNIAGDVTVVFNYNTVNAQYNPNLQSTLQHQGAEPGNETFEYNYLINNPQHVFHLDGSGTFTIKYNFGNGIGHNPDHADWLYHPGNTAGVVINEAFNTVYSSPNGCCTTAFCYMSISSVPYSGYCENDVYISNVSVQTGTAGNGTVSAPVRIDEIANMGPLTISNIYMDLRGAFYPFLATGDTSPVPVVTCTGNKSLVDGTALTNATGQSWMVCH